MEDTCYVFKEVFLMPCCSMGGLEKQSRAVFLGVELLGASARAPVKSDIFTALSSSGTPLHMLGLVLELQISSVAVVTSLCLLNRLFWKWPWVLYLWLMWELPSWARWMLSLWSCAAFAEPQVLFLSSLTAFPGSGFSPANTACINLVEED